MITTTQDIQVSKWNLLKLVKRKMRKKFGLICTANWFTWNLKKKTQFAIGDKVRISKCKRQVFDKGYTPNWTEEAEVFVIDEVLPIKSVTCKIVDLMGEAIGGSFYEQELQKTEQEIFSIDKVLRRYNKKKIALVRWSGYPDKFNSCVSFKDLVWFLIQILYYKLSLIFFNIWDI